MQFFVYCTAGLSIASKSSLRMRLPCSKRRLTFSLCRWLLWRGKASVGADDNGGKITRHPQGKQPLIEDVSGSDGLAFLDPLFVYLCLRRFGLVH
jgi:hypothetical protein